MATRNRYDFLPERIVSLIRMKAREVRNYVGFSEYDVEDVEQELAFAAWQARERFDHRRGASEETFLSRVVNNRFRDILRHRNRMKHDARLERSMDGGSNDLDEKMLLESMDARLPEDMALLELDLERAFWKLPPELRELFVRLGRGETVSEIARDMGVPRTTLSDSRRKLKRAMKGLMD